MGGKVFITGAGLIQGMSCGNSMENTITPEQYEYLLSGRMLRNVDRISKLTLAAAQIALNEGRITIDPGQSTDYGLVFGTQYGALESIHEFDTIAVTKGALAVNPGLFPNTVLNAPACQVGIQLSIAGPIYTVCNGVTSSSDAIGLGYYMIRSGTVSMVLTGAADELSKLSSQMHESTLPVMESSAFLILQQEEDIDKGNSNILGEIVGYASIELNQPAENRMSEYIISTVRKMLDENGKSGESLKEIYFNINPQKEESNKYCKTICKDLAFEGEFALNQYNCMGAGDMVQIVSSLTKTRGNIVADTVCLYISIGHEKCSILMINIKTGGNKNEY